jgi:SnoaL-like protein
MKPSLEDRQAITELLSRYGLLIDQRRLDEWMELFLADAVIEVPGRTQMSTGPDRRGLAAGAPPGEHLVAPPIIRAGNSDDSALVEQSFQYYNLETRKVLVGWYEDELVKREDTWYIARRAINYFRA